MPPGERLKKLRLRLEITTREVTERSQQIAEAEGNEEYSISNAWLTQIENTPATPSIYKLYSLSTIYHVRFADLLLLFGVDLRKTGKHQLSMPLKQTHLTNIEIPEANQSVTLPARFAHGLNLGKTSLLSRMVEVWGAIPVSLMQHLNLRHGLYGYVGLEDYTLFPLLRPGTFVQIEPKLKRVQTSNWRTEFDRPIYFVELRDGYVCSWCELHENNLVLVPHPLSSCSIRQFVHGTDAEIVGQVTGIAMRIADTDRRADRIPQLPKRS